MDATTTRTVNDAALAFEFLARDAGIALSNLATNDDLHAAERAVALARAAVAAYDRMVLLVDAADMDGRSIDPCKADESAHCSYCRIGAEHDARECDN